ncbi:MAG: hypothetical protein KIT09_02140 [Bryobacteraceae bacterium]|nr:hypothetical protein [Bryobacteraceae bacterium]
MPDPKLYWKAVRALQANLPDPAWITDIEHPANIVAVPSEVAAKAIFGKTHRLATEDELAAWRAEQEQLARFTRAAELHRAGVAPVLVKP